MLQAVEWMNYELCSYHMGGFLVIKLIRAWAVFFSPGCFYFSFPPETIDVIVVIMVRLEVCTHTKPLQSNNSS